MKWFDKLKIGTKIILGIVITCLLTIAVGLVSIFAASQTITIIALAAAVVLTAAIWLLIAHRINKTTKILLGQLDQMCFGQFDIRLPRYDHDGDLSSRNELDQIGIKIDQFVHYLQRFIIVTINNIAEGDIEAVATFTKNLGEDSGQTPEFIAAILENDKLTNPLMQTVNIISTMLSSTMELTDNIIAGNMRSRIDTSEFNGEWLKLAAGINGIVDVMGAPVAEASMVMTQMAQGDLQIRVVGDYKGDHERFIKTPLNLSLSNISSYVSEISEVLTAMANSDLKQEIVNDYPGDFSPIKDALNLIISSFNKVLTEMHTAADQVTAGARQVSDGSQTLSQGATIQASSVEQLTASLNEIASQTKKNAINANEASELAIETRGNAINGNARMKDLQNAMEDINISSKSISKIIKVIDDIAFQTNILALNAAVEAARAGQHGKGFAVVAEEVRNLAARSAAAANQTTDLIEGSIKKVELGTKIANETATALDKIVSDITKSANLISEIAEASNSQATGISQINQGVEQVSQVVQANSATAEESAAASEELSGQAEMLKGMIGRFKLRTSEGAGPATTVRQRTIVKTEKTDTKSSKEKLQEYMDKMAENDPALKIPPPEPAVHTKKARIVLSDNEFDKF